ncbi:hypothetical protein [Halorubrum aidingense]|uniref:hypothetical protein n=1 Tax=Halorubrum aidingense TaxID=368623 RepID=UPI001266F67F|nr:hypothetical protein [Halorubrum aidingense]
MTVSNSNEKSRPSMVDIFFPLIFSAIFGGLLFGPIGALIGAVLGATIGGIVGSRDKKAVPGDSERD